MTPRSSGSPARDREEATARRDRGHHHFVTKAPCLRTPHNLELLRPGWPVSLRAAAKRPTNF